MGRAVNRENHQGPAGEARGAGASKAAVPSRVIARACTRADSAISQRGTAADAVTVSGLHTADTSTVTRWGCTCKVAPSKSVMWEAVASCAGVASGSSSPVSAPSSKNMMSTLASVCMGWSFQTGRSVMNNRWVRSTGTVYRKYRQRTCHGSPSASCGRCVGMVPYSLRCSVRFRTG